MAASSSMLPLGTLLPPFRLQDASTRAWVDSSERHSKRGTLVIFMCNHCPYVVHVRTRLVEVANDAVRRGFAVWAINSNSEKTHPQDGPAAMKTLATEAGFAFPFLFDESQAVAKAFNAQCTPEFYLFDANQKLAYRGQFDESRPKNDVPVTGSDLVRALAAVEAGQAPDPAQKPSVGCGIKWHPEAETG